MNVLGKAAETQSSCFEWHPSTYKYRYFSGESLLTAQNSTVFSTHFQHIRKLAFIGTGQALALFDTLRGKHWTSEDEQAPAPDPQVRVFSEILGVPMDYLHFQTASFHGRLHDAAGDCGTLALVTFFPSAPGHDKSMHIFGT